MSAQDSFDIFLSQLRPAAVPASLIAQARAAAQAIQSARAAQPADAMQSALIAHEMARQPWLKAPQNPTQPPVNPTHPIFRHQQPSPLHVIGGVVDQGQVLPGAITIGMLPMHPLPPAQGPLASPLGAPIRVAVLSSTPSGALVFCEPNDVGGGDGDKKKDPCEGIDFENEIRKRLDRLNSEDAATRAAAYAELHVLAYACDIQMANALRKVLDDKTIPQDANLLALLRQLLERSMTAPANKQLLELLQGSLEGATDPAGNLSAFAVVNIACKWRGVLAIAAESAPCAAEAAALLDDIMTICRYKEESDPRTQLGLQAGALAAARGIIQNLPQLLNCLK